MEILKWPGGCSSGGGCWGGQGQCSGEWRNSLGRSRGCEAELGVFGPTKGVAADRGRRFFYIKDKHYFEVQII